MSGRKESEYRLAAERAQKLELAQQLDGLRSEVGHLRERVAEALKGASAGLRASFPDEAKQAESWLASSAEPVAEGLDANSDKSALENAAGSAAGVAAEGRRAHEALTVAFTQKADALGKQLAQQLASAEQLFMGRRQLLDQWFGRDAVGRWERSLEDARHGLQQEQYPAVESALAALGAELAARGRHAEEQEAKHQKRLYLVNALRSCCAEMGFREVFEPVPENEADRGSPIRYRVDTLDRGMIDFAVTLETIHTFAEDADTPDANCFEAFDQISGFLQEHFGLDTKFKYSDGRPRPELVHKKQIQERRAGTRSASQ